MNSQQAHEFRKQLFYWFQDQGFDTLTAYDLACEGVMGLELVWIP